MSTVAIKIKAFIPERKLKVIGRTFDGDNRGFSFDGSYRIAQYIKVDLDDLEIITNMASTGPTCEDVPELKLRVEGALNKKVTVSPAHRECGKAGTSGIKLEDIKVENNILSFKAVGAASNPLVALSPDIDYEMYFTVRKNGRVCVAGGHDGFPNYEVWTQKNNEAPKNIYSYSHGTNEPGALYPPMDKDIAVGTCS